MKPAAQVITTDGQVIELHDELNANALFYDCMTSKNMFIF